ncbi:1853_t:CDS:2 [Diversispora eburnea]|uniref:1853_t:CDS:1 n=1 Tax=Diversispora eburnea TaxID=1213867 RepID=A0A9N8ZHU0_9GLOM|nr:1853_t:CDS:2 [Diversispora eburnea]
MGKNKKQSIDTINESPKSDWFKENMSREHCKYCYEALKVLKRHPNVFPFLDPVDPVKFGIPDYLDIIKKPMDLGTVEKKLNNFEYSNVNEFIAEVRLVFSNCITYNGVSHQFALFAKELNNLFTQQIEKMPGAIEEQGSKAESSKLANKVTERPKRTIKPTSKDLPDSPAVKRKKTKSNAEINYCRETLKELKKKVHWSYAYPFYEPVDAERLGIPDYYKIITHPMDITTISSKLDNEQYSNVGEFEADVRLMFRNCYVYNGPNSEVANMGKMLEAVFDKKWANKPIVNNSSRQKSKKLKTSATQSRSKNVAEDSSDDSISEDDSDSQVEKWKGLEEHLKAVQRQIELIKKKKSSKSKKALKHEVAKLSNKVHGKTVAVGSAKRPKRRRPSGTPKGLTKNQKKNLSEKIVLLSKESMAYIINLVRDRNAPIEEDDQGEVSFEIDELDPQLAREIYDYTMKNVPKAGKGKKSQPSAKRPRNNQNLDNEERIKALEDALVKFDQKLPSPVTEASNENPDNSNESSPGSQSTSGESSESLSSNSSGSDSEGSSSESETS